MPTAIDDERLREAGEAALEAGRAAASDGEVASYIPALSKAAPEAFGLVLSGTGDTEEHAFGDADVPFPIQSISKVFALTLAMREVDSADGVARALWSRVGREPSGDPFNSLVQLEHESGVPRNPMINAGALVVHDVLLDHCDDAGGSLLELLSELAGEQLEVDQEIARSERDHQHRNRAMAHLMADFGNLRHPVEEVLEGYVAACAISMTTRQLARAVRFLAADGVDPDDGTQVIGGRMSRRVNAIMLTCGTYDAAGEFAFRVGLPCKSGVAGAIVGVVPDRMGVCVWSPPLGSTGNSTGGLAALDELTTQLELSVF